jgi:NAD(P)-dependent dehydrogenase (short-subunit alcohol dehydrogenase family)
MRLKDKVAIVTGGASGIGRGIATLFAREGAAVIVADRSQQPGTATVDEIVKAGGVASFVPVELGDADSIRAMVEAAPRLYGGLDILVNNAARFGLNNYLPLADTPVEEWDATVAVNLRGAFIACKFAIPLMIKRGGGSIVNLSSIGGLAAFPRFAAYVSSKGGLHPLTKSIALDYGRHGIRANLICPGAIDTPGNDPFIATSYASREEYVEKMGTLTPLGRMGRPEDIAYAALYLASDEAAYVSGACIVVDGGRTAGA